MKRETIEKKAKKVVVECLVVEEGIINFDSNLEKDLGADSLDKTELVMHLEEKFNLEEILDTDADKINTFGQIVDYLEEKLK